MMYVLSMCSGCGRPAHASHGLVGMTSLCTALPPLPRRPGFSPHLASSACAYSVPAHLEGPGPHSHPPCSTRHTSFLL
jgi:hypothetical protein